MSELPDVRASDREREQAVTRLREAAAEGRLTLEEFTARIDGAYGARTRGELDVLVNDLPEASASSAAVPARRTPRRWIVSVMGNAVRRGRWRVAEHATAVTVMGNATIDLRQAELSGPEVTVTVFTAMGNTHVIVPPGVDVDLSAIAIMGNRFDRTRAEAQPGAPLVRIKGVVLMGNIFVRTR
jgi:redox-sensitive bicupin YhaK (pirin superfamily)